MAPKKVACTCRTHACGGKRIPKALAQQHQLEDANANAPIQAYNTWAANAYSGLSRGQGSTNRFGSVGPGSSSGGSSSEDGRPKKRTRVSGGQSLDRSSVSGSGSSHSSPGGGSQSEVGSGMASPAGMTSPARDATASPAQSGEQAEGGIGVSGGEPVALEIAGQLEEEGGSISNSDSDEGGISETEMRPDLLGQQAPIEVSGVEYVENSNKFIRSIREATLDNDKISEDTLYRLRNPSALQPSDLFDGDPLPMDMYKATCRSADRVYNEARDAINQANERAFQRLNLPEDHEPPLPPLPSLHMLRKEIMEVTGVCAVEDEMCITGCHAFVGAFEDEEVCSDCGEPRWAQDEEGTRLKDSDGNPFPQQHMSTFPLGPQLQAIRQSQKGAQALRYRHSKVAEVRERMAACNTPEERDAFVYDDIYCGEDYLKLHDELNLTEDDVVVGFSTDGAQLYEGTASDTWIAVWIIQDYDPTLRFKRKYVLPALVVPGPNKPKNIDSFTYRSFYHLSALQRENNCKGMKVWDGLKQAIVLSRVIFHLATADAPALVELDGRVGHHGAQGCRLGCPMKGRHKPGSGHYYAVHALPHGYTVKGCAHPDVDVRTIRPPDPVIYKRNLDDLARSKTQSEYEKARKRTGLCKPSILSGLVDKYMLTPPKCFTVDLMHLLFLNVGELLLPLWRGTLPAGRGDDSTTWPWATLQFGTAWQDHGAQVEASRQYFPSSFHRPPRNPALFINSSFKATEWYLYLYGLGPAFFRTFLPPAYWRNFCRLVVAVRIMVQRKATYTQLMTAHHHAMLFVEEFEMLYYQRKPSRLHFCRPWLHTLLHVVPDALRVGPGPYYTQFTTERAIGYLGQEIRQPSNPHRNLAKIAERECQLNALKVLYPRLDPPKSLPRGSHDCGSGYVLRPPRSRTGTTERLVGKIGELLKEKYGDGGNDIRCWGKLTLPNGQKVRSLYAERRGKRQNTRYTRNVKLRTGTNTIRYGEVQLYFMEDGDPALPNTGIKAIVSLYSPPNQTLYEESYGALYACTYSGENGLAIVDAADIISLSSMQPMPPMPGDPPNLWCPVEKSGLEDVEIIGAHYLVEDDDDDDDDDEYE